MSIFQNLKTYPTETQKHLLYVYTYYLTSLLFTALGYHVFLWVDDIIIDSFYSSYITFFILFILGVTTRNKFDTLRASLLFIYAFLFGFNMEHIYIFAQESSYGDLTLTFSFIAGVNLALSMIAFLMPKGIFLFIGEKLFASLVIIISLLIVNDIFDSLNPFNGFIFLVLPLRCMYLLYDTQLTVSLFEHGDDDAIWHAVNLYLDNFGILQKLMVVLLMYLCKPETTKE